ncbi:hypothetical protein BJ165DRAFT_1419800 [Panaeolus papilionaceus]|nr:hypothetical protein BJ165DRAFT_1419800 [Panaeolus papilionaceus]
MHHGSSELNYYFQLPVLPSSMSSFLAFRTVAVHACRFKAIHRSAILVPSVRPSNLKSTSPLTGTTARALSSAARSHPKNRQIPYPVVQLLDSETGQLHAPAKLDHLLSTIDVQTHLVRLVSHQPPIVRVLSIAEDKKEKLERKLSKGGRVGGSGVAGAEGVSPKLGLARGEEYGGEIGKHVILPVIQTLKSTSGGASNKAGRINMKTIQLTWSSSPADTAMKLSKARDELERGGTSTRVELTWVNKRGQRPPLRSEMVDILDKAVSELADVGAEYKERDYTWRWGGVKVFVQGTTKKTQGVVTEDMLEELAKEEVKRFERQAARLKEKKEKEKAEKESWDKQFGNIL